MSTAYLIAVIDSTSNPPQIAGVSILSERWQTATLRHSPTRCYVNLWESSGKDWEEARANLREEIEGPRGYPGLHWALAWVDSSDNKHPDV